MSVLCLNQLAGTGVLAIGLWLRFDKKTEGLFQAENAPSTFLTGKKIKIKNSLQHSETPQHQPSIMIQYPTQPPLQPCLGSHGNGSHPKKKFSHLNVVM